MTKCRILLIGHGSRTGESADVLKQTAAFMQEIADKPVHYAFLEFAAPSVADALFELRMTDAEELVVIPLLFARGTHTQKTIPALLGFAEGEKTGTLLMENGTRIPVFCAEPVGADRRLAEILLERGSDATG